MHRLRGAPTPVDEPHAAEALAFGIGLAHEIAARLELSEQLGGEQFALLQCLGQPPNVGELFEVGQHAGDL
jgi:hypothetical protein